MHQFFFLKFMTPLQLLPSKWDFREKLLVPIWLLISFYPSLPHMWGVKGRISFLDFWTVSPEPTFFLCVYIFVRTNEKNMYIFSFLHWVWHFFSLTTAFSYWWIPVWGVPCSFSVLVLGYPSRFQLFVLWLTSNFTSQTSCACSAVLLPRAGFLIITGWF